MSEQLIKEIFNYGTPFVILAVVVWGLFKLVKGASGVINAAILHPESGWLSAVNRTANATETYLTETAQRDKQQQVLCQQHAESIAGVAKVLEGSLQTTAAIHTDLKQCSTDTNEKLDRIQNAICEACDATCDIVRRVGNEEVQTAVRNNCEKIKRLLRES